jgi:hypothetical protein
MKRCALLILFSLNAFAADLTVHNSTGADMRITELSNKCVGAIIKENKPVYLRANEEYTVKNVIPVVHSYTVCGSGTCASTAIGMKDAPKYTLNVVLDKDGWISGNPTPDHWVGNLDCPKE